MLILVVVLLYFGIFCGYELFLFIFIGFGVMFVNIFGGSMVVVMVVEDFDIKKMGFLVFMEKYGIMNLLYYILIKSGLLFLLIFMGVGVMIDFGLMLCNFKLVFFGVVV